MEYTILKSLFVFFFLLLIIYFITPYNLKLIGRPLWHNPRKFVNFKLDDKGTSQQILDIYSFSHITHGILLLFF